ncbi:MAG: hypothetical protein ACOYK6_00305 [Chthoniobacterales bacterium]
MWHHCGASFPREGGNRVLEYLLYTAGLRSSFDSLAPAHLALAGLPNGSLPNRLPSGRFLTLHTTTIFFKMHGWYPFIGLEGRKVSIMAVTATVVISAFATMTTSGA